MSISSACMNGLLREEQGFNGVVITDAVGMQGVAAGRTPLEVNTAVYRAGSDMILMPDDVKPSIDAITDSVATGVWPIEELDAKVRKVLELKARAGFFDEGYDPQVRDLDTKVAEARHRGIDVSNMAFGYQRRRDGSFRRFRIFYSPDTDSVKVERWHLDGAAMNGKNIGSEQEANR